MTASAYVRKPLPEPETVSESSSYLRSRISHRVFDLVQEWDVAHRLDPDSLALRITSVLDLFYRQIAAALDANPEVHVFGHKEAGKPVGLSQLFREGGVFACMLDDEPRGSRAALDSLARVLAFDASPSADSLALRKALVSWDANYVRAVKRLFASLHPPVPEEALIVVAAARAVVEEMSKLEPDALRPLTTRPDPNHWVKSCAYL